MLKILSGIILALTITTGILYYRSEHLKEQNVVLQTTHKQNIQYIKTLEEEATYAINQIETINEERIEIEIEAAKLSKTIAKHDLAELIQHKPNLVESIINTATEQTLWSLTEISQ